MILLLLSCSQQVNEQMYQLFQPNQMMLAHQSHPQPQPMAMLIMPSGQVRLRRSKSRLLVLSLLHALHRKADTYYNACMLQIHASIEIKSVLVC